jgi:hypothetical protein
MRIRFLEGDETTEKLVAAKKGKRPSCPVPPASPRSPFLLPLLPHSFPSPSSLPFSHYPPSSLLPPSTNPVAAVLPADSDEKFTLTPEEIEKRSEFENECCFVSLENWRETTLGLGLLVRPRTIRERVRKLIPVIELVEDYVSSESYNLGVR